eukprot:3451606-Rhodomonas_salina.1
MSVPNGELFHGTVACVSTLWTALKLSCWDRNVRADEIQSGRRSAMLTSVMLRADICDAPC